jgi:hypothetical protein
MMCRLSVQRLPNLVVGWHALLQSRPLQMAATAGAAHGEGDRLAASLALKAMGAGCDTG